MSKNGSKKRFLIVTSDTGGGHKSAAAAIADGLRQFGGTDLEVRISRALEDSSLLTRVCVNFYNYLLRHHQNLVRYYFAVLEWYKPNESKLFYALAGPYFRKLIKDYAPDVIISVHPMTQHYLAKALQDLGLSSIPIVSVVTDPTYGFWSGWACDEVSLYLVASEGAQRQMIDFGVPAHKIKICGMPIHPKFAATPARSRTETLKALGLDPEKFTVFVNAGWVGGGNIPGIFAELLGSSLDQNNTQVIFLAGRNDALRREMEILALGSPLPHAIVGLSDNMDELMRASDVMISKLGGLTTFEALALNLPIIGDTTTPPMPQETSTANLLTEKKVGIPLKHAKDIVPIVRRLRESPDEIQGYKTAAREIAVPDATEKIVKELLASH